MAPVLVSCDLLCSGTLGPEALCVDLWWALQVLMLYPSSHESVIPSLQFTLVSVVFAVSLKTVGALPAWHVACGASIMLGCALFRCLKKYSEVPPLFHVSAVWNNVEDQCALFHLGTSLWMGMMMVVVAHSAWACWAWAACMAVWYGLQYYRVYTRCTLLLGKDKETLIRKTQRGSAYREPIHYVDSDSRSAALFNDVVRIMETKKPWLQDDFGVDDLARLTHTNRMYLSKSINFHSGRNFNQLVNFYRIRYAIELLKKDPNLKMNEVSQMAGFHTVVSFNMAFKLNERMTPTEFIQSLKKLN